jgi:tetratricopeptide (TPR) repeat protein
MMQDETMQAGTPTDSADPERLYKEAHYYLKRREPNMAIHVLNRALEAKPGDPRFLSCLGLCKAMVNRRSKEALELCEKALASGAFGDFFYCNLGKVYSLRGNKRKAYAAFQAGLKTNPRNREIVQELRAMGIRQTAFFSSLPRGHIVNRFVGRMRSMLRRSAA